MVGILTSCASFLMIYEPLYVARVGKSGCLFENAISPTLFNIFLEKIMTDALEDHEGTVSFGGRTIAFADDIDGLAGEEEELAKLAERLDKASTAYGLSLIHI